ncbi:hypothetical protein BD324DRAFT_637440 [Kockovaella imperatae]|uniref:Uncharacterized protein n=1 Tax=Kockovaella imperatae TaxID=4999 RepID=A0A1Y1U9V8_9TREE|nr:hypothetical protein BD324DRAFT_637440 [Kockovaella imperatae]ORX34297.1 hypothetical protein BD324DRAFT_637440 [Kockovaella imperatae]
MHWKSRRIGVAAIQSVCTCAWSWLPLLSPSFDRSPIDRHRAIVCRPIKLLGSMNVHQATSGAHIPREVEAFCKDKQRCRSCTFHPFMKTPCMFGFLCDSDRS